MQEPERVGGQALPGELGQGLVPGLGLAQGGRGRPRGDQLVAELEQGVRELDDAGAVGDVEQGDAGAVLFRAQGSISLNCSSVSTGTPSSAALRSLEPAASPATT